MSADAIHLAALDATRTFRASMGGDRHVRPTLYTWRYMTLTEVLALDTRSSPYFVDRRGQVRQLRVTSVKRWKSDPLRIRIGCKYGMYEFFTLDGPEALRTLCVRVDDASA